MQCYVCDQDSWKKVMVMRDGKESPIHTEVSTQICKNCGNACHEVDPSKEAAIKEYYRKEYRPEPNISNLITTTHKQNYIQIFLRDFLLKNKGKRLKIADVGCATGYLLGFFKRLGHLVTGCEYTIPYRRMAEHYYGVPVTEELETKHKYDLIVIYHVLEHMMLPDKKLEHYASLLADGGKMLIATPEWFGCLQEDSGGQMKSFDHLYHKNHINLFSRQSLRNLFRKAGLSVVKEDFEQYGQSYLLEKAAPGQIPADWLVKENWVDVEREMLRDYKAINLFLSGRAKEALEVKNNFPEAWINLIYVKAAKDVGRQAELFADAEKIMPYARRLIMCKAQWLYQQGRLEEALEYYGKVTSYCPNEDLYMFMGYCCAQLGRIPEAVGYFETAQSMDPRKWVEAQSWVLKLICSQPTWDERLMQQAKDMMFKGAVDRGEIVPQLEDVLVGDKMEIKS